jgi:hypothetical protein
MYSIDSLSNVRILSTKVGREDIFKPIIGYENLKIIGVTVLKQ